MKYSAIEKKYKNKWVLLECTKTTEDFKILEANVLATGKIKEELYSSEREFFGKIAHPLAIEYLGKIPEDIALVL